MFKDILIHPIINILIYKGPEGFNMGTRDKKYWISVNTPVWVIILIASFIIFFPAFVAFMIMWAVGRIEVSG